MTPKELVFDVYYIYFLIDPRNEEIFYIGKGKGNRINDHVKNARKGVIDNVKKYQRINEIHDAGYEVTLEKKHIYLSEREAYKLERELIADYKYLGLTNIQGGIVTNAELNYQKSLDLLNRIKPFNRWIYEINDDIRRYAFNKHGSPYACWENMKNEILFMVKYNANA